MSKLKRILVLVILAWSALQGTVSAQMTSNTIYYLDLSKGDITLLPNKIDAYYWENNTWNHITSGHAETGPIYYILLDPKNQFHGDPNATAFKQYYGYDKGITTTTGSGGTVNIVNNSDVTGVLTAWKTRAQSIQGTVSRPSTSHKITVACNSGYTILMDNVWSTYQGTSDTGGLTFKPQKDQPCTLNVILKGDNRLGNVFFCSKLLTYPTISNTDIVDLDDAHLVFRSYESFGSSKGTLTVGNISPGSDGNHYNSVIGGSDSYDYSKGIEILGGTIFAGAEPKEECTAIGAGGNGKGVVTISGGVVTAVTSSTGAAIGGGIGWGSAGGPGEVTISGGKVYAYNHGFYKDSKFVPAAAIGGGSSSGKAGAKGTVTITGGTVYAQSTGGVAIGGGGSASATGGAGNITISGGSVTAKSISGNPYTTSNTASSYSATYASSIGGGRGSSSSSGGICTFNMSAGTLQAGSVGGGSGSTIGKATISITGGDIRAQFVMAGTGSSFTMSAGTIHNSNTNATDFKLVKSDGGAVWQGASNGTVNITGGTIDECQATNGGAIYTTGGTVNVSNANITNCTATSNGGAFYLEPNATISMTSGSIVGNSATNGGGVYLASGAKLTYTTNSTSTGYIRNNTASNLGGGVYLAQGTTSKKTELSFVLNSTKLGFYDNIAGVGGDDIYAYGAELTKVNIPAVTNMSLGDYSVAGATLEWYEDYKVNDNRYSAGTQQKGSGAAITRYRAARDASLPVWKVPASVLSTSSEKYLCLTLGFEYGELEIRRSGLLARQSAIYKVEFQGTGLNRPTQYITVLGTTEDEKTTIDGVRWNISRIQYLPKGTYKVTEIPWTWYNDDKSTAATVKTQDINTEAGQIFEFANSTAAVATLPRHDEERKENDLSPAQ